MDWIIWFISRPVVWIGDMIGSVISTILWIVAGIGILVFVGWFVYRYIVDQLKKTVAEKLNPKSVLAGIGASAKKFVSRRPQSVDLPVGSKVVHVSDAPIFIRRTIFLVQGFINVPVMFLMCVYIWSIFCASCNALVQTSLPSASQPQVQVKKSASICDPTIGTMQNGVCIIHKVKRQKPLTAPPVLLREDTLPAPAAK
jgi:hypothetical protein